MTYDFRQFLKATLFGGIIINSLLLPFPAMALEATPDETQYIEHLKTYRSQIGEPAIDYNVIEIPTDRRRVFIPQVFKADQSSLVSINQQGFVSRISKLSNGRPIVVELFAGYSAAEYDRALLSEDLKQYLTAIIQNNKLKFGKDAITLLLAGGTQEGIGFVYDPEIQGSDLIKAGIVSNQALKYEMQYGNQLGKQDALFLVDSYTENNKKSWEVKSRNGDLSMNNFIHDLVPSKESHFSLFEGGEVGFKEALEWLIERGAASYQHRRFQLDLILGYRPKNIKKDSGYRAATFLSQLLIRFPELAPSNVTIRVFQAGKLNEPPLSITEFRQRKEGRKLLERNSSNFLEFTKRQLQKFNQDIEEHPTWFEKNKFNVQAKMNQLRAWSEKEGVAQKIINEAIQRNLSSLEHWNEILNPNGRLTHPDNLEDVRSGVAHLSVSHLKKRNSELRSITNRLEQNTQAGLCRKFFL